MAIRRLLTLIILAIFYSIVNAQTKPCERCDLSKCPMVIFI